MSTLSHFQKMEPEAGSSCYGVGKPLYSAAHAQTLLLPKSHPEVMQVAHRGERRCYGGPVGCWKETDFPLLCCTQLSAPCQRKNMQLVSRMGSGDMGFICSPVADFVQIRTRP